MPSPKQITDRCEDLYIVQFKLLKWSICYPEPERICYYLNKIEKTVVLWQQSDVRHLVEKNIYNANNLSSNCNTLVFLTLTQEAWVHPRVVPEFIKPKFNRLIVPAFSL